MSFSQTNPESVQDIDCSSIDTALTPPETIPPELTDDKHDLPNSASYRTLYPDPKAGSTYIIRSISSRDTITFLKGQVVLAPPDSLGSPHWECEKNGGWLGFRNIASNGYLGRNGQWLLCCSANKHKRHEWFQIGNGPEGGHVLILPTDDMELQPVGIKEEEQQKLAMISREDTSKIVYWEFVEV